MEERVPLGCIYDVVDEVPQGNEEDEDVVDPEEGDSALEYFRSLIGIVVEDFQTAGIVKIVPIYLLRL